MRPARSIAYLALVAVFVVLSGCPSGGSSGDRGEFVAYYADPDAYCSFVAECEVQDKKSCVLAWPSESDVERAIDLAQLGSDELSSCESASRAFDDCYLGSSCAELKSAEAPCSREQQRFQLDCAGLLAALNMTPVEEPGGGDDGESNTLRGSGGSGVAAAEALCQLSTNCTGSPANADQHSQCVEAAAPSFGLLPDPGRVLECLEAMGCAQLEAGGQEAALGCIAVDPDATMCLDQQTLDICDTYGACSTIDCPSFCADQGFGFVGCAFDSADGYDKCQCSI